jgi:hypothetical protein
MFLVIELIVAIAVLAVRPGKLTSSYRAGAAGAAHSSDRPGPRAVLPTLPPTTAPPPPATVDSVPPGQQVPGDQAIVTGTVTQVQASTATVGTVPMPIRVVAAERGSGNSATINGAEVDGKPADVEWDAGTPFPLSGDGGGLDLVGVTVHVDGGGATAQLGGGSYALKPGSYHLASPAAVSSNGLAAPVTSVDFTAVAGTSVTFVGSETLDLPLPLHLTGPGKVVLDGTFTVRTAQGSRPATHVELGSGPYDLKVRAGPGGPQITAILQGTFTIG